MKVSVSLNFGWIKFERIRRWISTGARAGGPETGLNAIADYRGTSVQMIEEDYLRDARVERSNHFRTVASNFLKNLASPTGFEPVLSA
jgi:hypothetical protein